MNQRKGVSLTVQILITRPQCTCMYVMFYLNILVNRIQEPVTKLFLVDLQFTTIYSIIFFLPEDELLWHFRILSYRQI